MRTSNDNFVPIHGTVMKMTRKAVLIRLDDRSEVWVPMSVIHEEDLAGLDEGVIEEINIAEWFYNKEIF